MRFFSLIHQGDVHPATEEKIISSEDFSTLVKAADLLKKARQDAKNLQKETKEECEHLKELAKQEGFQEGLDKFNDHLLSFERSWRTLHLELQQQIIPIALKAAKKIVADQLELNPETIVDIVLQALAPAAQNHRFIIYVNKVDKEILEAQKSKIKNLLDQMQSLTIQERSDISVGGCIIETEAGIINATIENQWRALEAAFEKYMK